MKKKVSAIALSVIALCSLCACGEKLTVDKAFIRDMEKGLEARWDVADEQNATTQEDWMTLISCELDMIGEYKDKDFEDKDLQALVTEYIGALEENQDILKYLDSDYQRFAKKHEDIFTRRACGIKQFVEKYGLTVSEEYQSDLDGMIIVANNYEQIKKLMETANFELTEDTDYFDTYSCTVENISDMSFSNFTYFITLKDVEGTVIDTPYAYATNWEKGSKYAFEFSTDKNPATIEVTSCYYEQ